tara:strand:+ start:1595 stop:1795 length:201 start_codon:yes stop_codon:yes gene_type:complete
MNTGRLLFAVTGHPEYRSYDSVDALIVGMDGTATVDEAQIGRTADLEAQSVPAGGQTKDGLAYKNN